MRSDLIDALFSWLREKRKAAYQQSDHAVDCEPEESRHFESQPRRMNMWEAGWLGMFAKLTGDFRIPPEAFCESREEVVQIADMVIRQLGRDQDRKKRMTPEESYEAGLRAMYRPEGEYRDFLVQSWYLDRSTVMKAMVRPKSNVNGLVQAGVSFVMPLATGVKEQLYDYSLQTRGLFAKHASVGASEDLLINAVTTDNESGPVKEAIVSEAQTSLVGYQLASLCADLEKTNVKPTVITFKAHSKNYKQLRVFGFQHVGEPLTTADHQICVLSPSTWEQVIGGKERLTAYATYQAMLLLMKIAQLSNSEERQIWNG